MNETYTLLICSIGLSVIVLLFCYNRPTRPSLEDNIYNNSEYVSGDTIFRD